jgi:hypothetical protein
VAWQLEAAGYTVELDVWDWAPGQNFVMAMSDALDRTDRVMALFSEAYFRPAPVHHRGMDGGPAPPGPGAGGGCAARQDPLGLAAINLR